MFSSASQKTVAVALQLLDTAAAGAGAEVAAGAGAGSGDGAEAPGATEEAAAVAAAGADWGPPPPPPPPRLFERGLVLCRTHTMLAPLDHLASPGGKSWDTVKPLAPYFHRMHRVLLVDDER